MKFEQHSEKHFTDLMTFRLTNQQQQTIKQKTIPTCMMIA